MILLKDRVCREALLHIPLRLPVPRDPATMDFYDVREEVMESQALEAKKMKHIPPPSKLHIMGHRGPEDSENEEVVRTRKPCPPLKKPTAGKKSLRCNAAHKTNMVPSVVTAAEDSPDSELENIPHQSTVKLKHPSGTKSSPRRLKQRIAGAPVNAEPEEM